MIHCVNLDDTLWISSQAILFNPSCDWEDVIEVCPACYKFFETIYDKKRMKDIKLDESQPCKSMYHKKLVDR